LKAIADYLEVSIAELLDAKVNDGLKLSPVNKAGTHKVMSTGDGTHHMLLNPGRMENEVIMVEFPPGSSTGKIAYEHSGYECGFVIEGELAVELEGQKYELGCGDSIVFDSQIHHKIINEKDKPVKAIWVNTVPWIFPKYTKENNK
jgi:quercetin dioxygenase-like cupin family protein